VSGIDVGRVFDRNFNRIKAPTLEFRKEFGAFVRKRGSKQKCVYADSHKDAARLIHPVRVSKRFGLFGGCKQVGEKIACQEMNCDYYSNSCGKERSIFDRGACDGWPGLPV